jgi:hypothetical protein
MLDRLSLYDTLAALIPGSLLVASIAVLFPAATAPFRSAALPSEFAVIALLAAAMLAGLLTQTVGSALERPLLRVFGGLPSDRALSGKLGERYLPRDAAKRIETKLRSRFGANASKRALFLGAMNLAESVPESKAAAFNAQYGHLRAVFTLFLFLLGLGVASRLCGAAVAWDPTAYQTSVLLLVVATALFAWRTWQRGAYYAREVLLTAERIMDTHAPVPPTGAGNPTTNS